MKTICFFGIYDPEYSRNRVLMRGFRENGWDVVECRADPKLHRGARKYVELVRAYARLPDKRPGLVLVAFPGQTVVWLARVLFGKDVIFDVFLSLYDSNVHDRKLYSGHSIRGVRDFILDWYSVRLTRFVLLDTNEHIRYFFSTFKMSASRFIRVLIGADDRMFSRDRLKIQEPKGITETGVKPVFLVEFHGMFIPLQGVEYIVKAAALLVHEHVIFDIIGSGQTFGSVKKEASDLGLKNIRFLGKVPLGEIPGHIARADACIGILGSTEKALRVIPNKVYECAAMGKPIITGDSPAVREVFTDGKDMLFCALADASSLADKIRLLVKDAALRRTLSIGSAETFSRRCSPKTIVAELLSDINI
jgi:glycosyltransferase involved in cell wall biosynthesis